MDPAADMWAFAVKEDINGKGDIKTVTIEELLSLFDKHYVDILKIDIEGAEKELFSNNTNWINYVGTLIVELHDRFKKGCSEAFYTATSAYDYRKNVKGENIILERVM